MFVKQSGFALITSVLILIALSILVLGGTQSTLMQEKMTAAVRGSHISLEIAESGVKDAEAAIEALTSVTGFSDSGADGLYSQDNGPSDYFSDSIWTDALTADATTEVSGVTAKYYIEYMGQVTMEAENDSITIGGYGSTTETTDSHVFKIVSRSTGIDGNTERVIVSYYGKNF